jgi:Concanavalin A-like lectin/glucanases superfamily
VLTDAGIFSLVNSAFRFNFNFGGLGCGTDAHGSVTAPNLGFSQNFTFSAWIKPQGNIDNNWIMGQADATGANPWVRMKTGQTTDPNNTIVYGAADTVSIILPIPGGIVVVSDPSAIKLDTWYHFAATVSLSSGTTTVKLYRNGTEVASKTIASTTMTNPSSTAKFLIGDGAQGASGNGGISLFKGVIDNVRVYGRALTVSEVNAVKDAPEN